MTGSAWLAADTVRSRWSSLCVSGATLDADAAASAASKSIGHGRGHSIGDRDAVGREPFEAEIAPPSETPLPKKVPRPQHDSKLLVLVRRSRFVAMHALRQNLDSV